MKKLVLFMLFTLPVMAQTSFKSEKGNIVWEHTYDVANADVIAMVDKDPNLKISSFVENVYKGSGNEVKNRSQGGSALMKNNCKFEFTVIVNPDSYTVIVKDLKIIEKYGPMGSRIMANPCEKYFANDKGLRSDDKAATDLACLDKYFTALFSTRTVTLPGQQATALSLN